MRGDPSGPSEITRPEYRAAIALLADMMTLLDQHHLADVCLRALDGWPREQIRAGSALASAIRLLRPEMPRGTEP
jgi:hypothetical protein